MTVIDFPTIRVNDRVEMSIVQPADQEALVRHLNDRTIYENTCNIPYPYRAKDAEHFIRDEYFFMDTHGKWRSLAIRVQGDLIGGIGLLYNHGIESFKSEIGYWLAKPYRGQGIMTAVVRRFSDHCLEELDFMRLEANVFYHNNRSMKVLEQAGFQKEGILRKAYRKEEQYLDSVLYARIRE